MSLTLHLLIEAEAKATQLFEEIEKRGLITPGISEKELNTAVYELAFELFGIKKYWHKRIVRAGKNTLLPYRENPPDLILREQEIDNFLRPRQAPHVRRQNSIGAQLHP